MKIENMEERKKRKRKEKEKKGETLQLAQWQRRKRGSRTAMHDVWGLYLDPVPFRYGAGN